LIPSSIAKQATGIEWSDFTANAWAGCARIKALTGARSGCDICYAESFCANRLGMSWGPAAERRRFRTYAAKMRRLDRVAGRVGLRFSVFSLSLGDYLDPQIPDDWRADLIDVVEACHHLDVLLLTHRPHLARKLLPESWGRCPPTHVWPGVTIDHPLHGFRWHQHLDFWGATGRSWISAEPLAASLASLDLSAAAVTIYGGASGTSDPTWRFDPVWIEEHLERYGAGRLFFKQWGDFGPDGMRLGKKAAGRTWGEHTFDFTPWARNKNLLHAAAAEPDMAACAA
jgi:protein gp37